MDDDLVIVSIIVLAIVWRLLLGFMDQSRVERFLRQHRDGELLEQHWAPFGPGWLETWLFPFPRSHPRIYRIVYRDLKGRVHDGYVRTSMESGVDVTYDRIIEDSAGSSLEDENEGLGRRIAQLERGRNRGV